jgi:membrane protein YdbS with pleckstrin-like domain
MDESDGPLTPLHPNHVKALRLAGLVAAIPLTITMLVGALVPLLSAGVAWPGFVLFPLIALVAWLVVFLPWRRYSARGYLMGADRLRVARGVMFRKDTVVPFGRVQHIDVERGPLERYYGLATLVLHTAGTHNASIRLPGLGEEDAVAMREAIRDRIAAAQA